MFEIWVHRKARSFYENSIALKKFLLINFAILLVLATFGVALPKE